MAKPDGTYYLPDENGTAPSLLDKPVSLFLHLVAGSGQATAYVEAQNPVTGNWEDVTSEVTGQAWLRARNGNVEDWHILDGLGTLDKYDAVRCRVVLDTAGVGDADYDGLWK